MTSARDLAFARRQRLNATIDGALLRPFESRRAVQFQSTLDGVQKQLIVEWFLEEIHGARLHGPHAHGHVAVAGYEYDRQLPSVAPQLFLKVEATQARHTHVEHEARRTVARPRGQEILGRIEGHGVEADRANQARDKALRTEPSSSTTITLGGFMAETSMSLATDFSARRLARARRAVPQARTSWAHARSAPGNEKPQHIPEHQRRPRRTAPAPPRRSDLPDSGA